jgi:hypothetical protein
MSTKGFYGVGAIFCISFYLLSCGPKDQQESTQGWEEEARKIKQTLIKEYDAVPFPPENYADAKVFTYNLKRLLANQESRPLVFDGFLDDIMVEEDQVFVHFVCPLSHDPSEDRIVKFKLNCSCQDVRPLLDNPPEYHRMARYLFLKGIRKDFLVLCVVTDVAKIVNYSVVGVTSEGSERIDLDIHSPDTFSARGKLLKMMKYSHILSQNDR